MPRPRIENLEDRIALSGLSLAGITTLPSAYSADCPVVSDQGVAYSAYSPVDDSTGVAGSVVKILPNGTQSTFTTFNVSDRADGTGADHHPERHRWRGHARDD